MNRRKQSGPLRSRGTKLKSDQDKESDSDQEFKFKSVIEYWPNPVESFRIQVSFGFDT